MTHHRRCCEVIQASYYIKQTRDMLVMGVCNPAGERAGYNGLYFTDSELRELAGEGRLLHVPVKAEHRGQELGRVVSSFVDTAGRLNCVMRIADDTVEGAIAAGLVKDGIARELSLGYSVDVAHSEKMMVAASALHQRQEHDLDKLRGENDTLKQRIDGQYATTSSRTGGAVGKRKAENDPEEHVSDAAVEDMWASFATECGSF
jgi:hypothetical protein